MADPQQATAEPAVGQSVGTPEPPVGQSVGTASGDTTSWLGHLWNIARTAGSDVASAGKNLFETAKQSEGDPFKFVTDLGAQAGQAQLDQLKQAWQLHEQNRNVEAVGHAIAGVTPGLGPIIAHVAEQVGTGDPEQQDEAVGHVLSMGAVTAAPEVAAEALPAIKATIAARQAGQAPLRVTRFAADLPVAVPPSNATPYTPADVARATPYLAAEHAASPVTTVQQTVQAADSAIAQIEDHIGKAIQSVPSGATLANDPVAAARAGLAQNVKADFLTKGMKELDNYPDLHDPDGISFEDADANRQQLNADNQAHLSQNKYDVATALKTDPAFAARYYASRALRSGIYDGLDANGVDGTQALRQDEGSLIAIRDAAQRQYFNGLRQVGGTGSTGPLAQAARRIVPAASAAIGAEVAGPAGAATADILGRTVTNAMLPGNLTRDALVARAFQRLGTQPGPVYPSIPTAPTPAGLLPAPARPLGSGPDTSGMTVTSQPWTDFPPAQVRGFLPAPARPLSAGPDTSGTGGLFPAQPILVRDPATGRFKRAFTSDIDRGGGS